MKFLPALRGIERKAVNDGGAMRRATTGPHYGFAGQPYSSSWSVERAVTDGFERVALLYKCVDAIASDLSSLRVVVREGDDVDGKEVEGGDLLRLLNRAANPFESGSDLRYRIVCILLLDKRGVFVEKVPSLSGGIAALHILPPGRVAPIPHPTQFVSGYRVTMPDGSFNDLPADRVMWIRKRHPTDPYLSSTPLEPLGISVDTAFYARLFNRNFMANDGRPGGVLTVQGRLSEDDAQALRARFAGGPGMAGRTVVMEADGTTWHDTSTTPRDAQYVETQAITKEDILMGMGVPETILGNASGRTFDNADAEEEIYYRRTIRNTGRVLESEWDRTTDGGVEDDLFVRHDYSTIAALQRDERRRREEIIVQFEKGGASLDDMLEAMGRERLNLPWSKVYWITAGMVPIGAKEDVEETHRVLKPLAGAPLPLAGTAATARNRLGTGDPTLPDEDDDTAEGVIEPADERATEETVVAMEVAKSLGLDPLAVLEATPGARRALISLADVARRQRAEFLARAEKALATPLARSLPLDDRLALEDVVAKSARWEAMPDPVQAFLGRAEEEFAAMRVVGIKARRRVAVPALTVGDPDVRAAREEGLAALRASRGQDGEHDGGGSWV